ncbi:uncharacterized protein LOC124278264 [Haliotis rubra]|uniref:uncharacterized protein LOC124278264 n=1 Tax=Haliotis rubra TaxID=36100 RepID=UPI001EE4FDB5|nr:uncharacterized protein LOC124278264 [Haliotis rubra]
MVPLVFLLLHDKKHLTYERALRLVKDAAEARMDFEVTAKNAVEVVFPGIEWKGCYFHFTQCIWRKTQQVGLKVEYSNNPDVNHFVRLCAVLPLVPLADVEDVWLQNVADMPQDDRCHQLADWIVGSLPMTSWNHYLTLGPRTNNNLEGWHGRVKKLVWKAHPNVFELIRFLLDEHKTTEVYLVQYMAGQRLPPKKKRYRDLQRKLDDLKTRLESLDLSVFDYAVRASYALRLA